MEEGLVENSRRVGEKMLAEVQRWEREIPIIKDARGRGLMIGFDIVEPGTDTLLDKKITRQIFDACLVARRAVDDLQSRSAHQPAARDLRGAGDGGARDHRGRSPRNGGLARTVSDECIDGRVESDSWRAARSTAPSRRYRGAVIGLGGVARGSHIPGFMYDEATRNRLEIVATVDGSTGGRTIDGRAAARHRAKRLARFATWTSSTSARPRRRISISRSGRSSRAITCSAKSPSRSPRARRARIADASRAARRVVMPCHQYRYNPVWVQLRKWLAEGAIGRWHLAELHVYRLMADRGDELRRDAVARAARGCGRRDSARSRHASHLSDARRRRRAAARARVDGVAAPSRLRCRRQRASRSSNIPSALGVMFLTWAARHRESHVRFIGDAGSIDWIGGMLRLEREGVVESFDYSAQLDKSAYPAMVRRICSTRSPMRWTRAISSHRSRDIGNVAAVLEGAYEAARSGMRARTWRPPELDGWAALALAHPANCRHAPPRQKLVCDVNHIAH